MLPAFEGSQTLANTAHCKSPQATFIEHPFGIPHQLLAKVPALAWSEAIRGSSLVGKPAWSSL